MEFLSCPYPLLKLSTQFQTEPFQKYSEELTPLPDSAASVKAMWKVIF